MGLRRHSRPIRSPHREVPRTGHGDASLDFVFIDAEHTYDAVKQDIAAWEPKIKPGGWVMGHDYCDKFPGVRQAVQERYGGREIALGPDDVWAVKT